MINDKTKEMTEFAPYPVENNNFSACATEDVLRTIAYLDETIEAEKEHIAYLDKQRQMLLTRAQVENITISKGYCLITTPESLYRNKILNVRKFAEKFPVAYEAIRAQQKVNIEDKFAREIEVLPNSDIPLSLADAKLGKDTVTEYVGYRAQGVKAEVRRIPEMLK